eukprot:scaffold2713_cov166-Alexandrium_tamarense.AAC.3
MALFTLIPSMGSRYRFALAFQVTPSSSSFVRHPSSSSRSYSPTNYLQKQYKSSAAVERSTFRRVRGTSTSTSTWMTSDDESSQPVPSSPTATTDLTAYQNPNNLDDQVFSAMSSDGGLKVTVATIRNLLNDMMIQHTMNPVPGDAIGSLGDDFTLREAVGTGTVQVVKNHPDWPRPYNGITAIRHGDIDRDVGIYLAESEQRSCALAAATSFNGILCTAAGGYLVERLPDCSPETMSHMERNLARLVEMDGGDALPTNLLLDGKTPLDIASVLLDGLGMEPLGSVLPKAFCECSDEKLMRSLRLLPRKEVDVILQEEGKIEARCQFCGKVYRMGPEEVENRLSEAQGDPSKNEDFGL